MIRTAVVLSEAKDLLLSVVLNEVKDLLPRSAAIALVLASLASPSQAQTGREPYPGWDAYVTQALATWKVPGAGIAIVRNDSVIYARGYGVRELGKPAPVTERTVFAIGSSSKWRAPG